MGIAGALRLRHADADRHPQRWVDVVEAQGGGRLAQPLRHNGAYDYAEWRLGLTRAFDNGVSVAAAWNDSDADRALYTNPQGRQLADGTLSLTLAKSF